MRDYRPLSRRLARLEQWQGTDHFNIWTDPEWARVRQRLMEALRPYPDARVAVAQALLALRSPWRLQDAGSLGDLSERAGRSVFCTGLRSSRTMDL